MLYSEKIEQHLSNSLMSVQGLIDTTFTYEELNQICSASPMYVDNLMLKKKMETSALLKRQKIKKNRSKIKAQKPKREKYSTKKLKLTKTGLSYQDYLDRIGYKPPDISNFA